MPKSCHVFFFWGEGEGHSLWEEKHISKIPPKSRDNPVNILFMCFLFMCFFSLPRNDQNYVLIAEILFAKLEVCEKLASDCEFDGLGACCCLTYFFLLVCSHKNCSCGVKVFKCYAFSVAILSQVIFCWLRVRMSVSEATKHTCAYVSEGNASKASACSRNIGIDIS